MRNQFEPSDSYESLIGWNGIGWNGISYWMELSG